uniref:Uncharacterized protein n=1 Tax=Oryza punctata TaxID=4537 RepID=A0A0E0K4K8_ORYPU
MSVEVRWQTGRCGDNLNDGGTHRRRSGSGVVKPLNRQTPLPSSSFLDTHCPHTIALFSPIVQTNMEANGES